MFNKKNTFIEGFRGTSRFKTHCRGKINVFEGNRGISRDKVYYRDENCVIDYHYVLFVNGEELFTY